jgi:hypothetical protein
MPVAFNGSAGLIAAVSLENISGGMAGAVFVALLMSLCNPVFRPLSMHYFRACMH